jgi:uncharacterized protein DUF6683
MKIAMKHLKIFKQLLLVTFLVISAPAFAAAQTWNSNAGGYNTGYGTVYGSFGLAQATQNIYNTMQIQMQKTVMRQAMIKKWGLAAVEKAEREAKNSPYGSAGKVSTTPTNLQVSTPPIAKNFAVFKPDPTVDTGKVLADSLGSTLAEKDLIKTIYARTKVEFEKEAVAKGMPRDLASAFTFFIVGNAVVFRDSVEPSDEAVNALYESINQTLDGIPEFGSMSNRDKQALYNTLIGFTGIPLATYAEGKQNGSRETIRTASALSGMLIRLILKIDPERIRFESGNVLMN